MNPIITQAATALLAYKVEKPVLIDLKKFRAITYDYLIICTCQSGAQMRAVLNKTRKILNRNRFTGVRIEYSPGVKWGILDCGELIIHLFEKNARNYYSLERLWSDATITELHTEDFISEVEEKIEEDEYL